METFRCDNYDELADQQVAGTLPVPQVETKAVEPEQVEQAPAEVQQAY